MFLYTLCLVYVQEAVTHGDEVKKPRRSKQEVCFLTLFYSFLTLAYIRAPYLLHLYTVLCM